jgi:hypothetical protein
MMMYHCSNELGEHQKSFAMKPANFCIFLTSIILILLVTKVVGVPAQLRASYDGTRWGKR